MCDNVFDNQECYESLATAIISNAVKDYETGRKLIWSKFNSYNYNHGMRLINDVKSFFHSEWFMVLTKKHIDGAKMYEQIKENFNRCQKCMPFDDGIY